MTEINLNQNLKECLRDETGITETIVHNVCAQEIYVIPHGAFDIILAVFCMTVILGIVAPIVKATFKF